MLLKDAVKIVIKTAEGGQCEKCGAKLLTATATVNGKDVTMTDGNAIVPLTVSIILALTCPRLVATALGCSPWAVCPAGCGGLHCGPVPQAAQERAVKRWLLAAACGVVALGLLLYPLMGELVKRKVSFGRRNHLHRSYRGY